jgi:hypothetical protein
MDLQLFARKQRVKFDEIPPEDKQDLINNFGNDMDPKIAEDVYNQHLAKEDEPEDSTSSGESPNPESNEAVTEEESNMEPSEEPEGEPVSESSEEEPSEGVEPAEPAQDAPIGETTAPVAQKGNLNVALHEVREENKRIKKEREQEKAAWQQEIEAIKQQMAQLSKPSATVPTPATSLPFLQQQINNQVPQNIPPAIQPPQSAPIQFSPQQSAQTPTQPQQSGQQVQAPQHPGMVYMDAIENQALDEFKKMYRRDPRTDFFEDSAGVLADQRAITRLESDINRRYEVKFQEDQAKQRKEQERVQTTVSSFRDWWQQESAQADTPELLQYADKQIAALPPDQKEIISNAFYRLAYKEPNKFGQPTPQDDFNVKTFWQMCRYNLGLQKIASQSQPEPAQLEQVDSFSTEPANTEPANNVVAATQKKLQTLQNLPRNHNIPPSGSTASNAWTQEKIKKYLDGPSEMFEQIPAQYRLYLETAGKRGEWPRT